MPKAEWFAYCWPNRRSEKTVVEITLDFGPADQSGFPQSVSDIRELLIKGGILGPDERFPEHALPEDRMAWYSSLLVQTALLFQRKAYHRVSFVSLTCYPEQNRCVALMEHEHCDVGMTAVKLAVEMMCGERKLLAEPFQVFSKFAGERLLPPQTEAIMKAAQRRDIPCVHLERQPYKRKDFDALTGGKCISPNGLLMLGYGVHQRVLDGTWCLDPAQDLGDQCQSTTADADSVATELLDRLFPDRTPVRMPIIAVTGTNGKTTATRMISHIMQYAGRKPGLVCTDGVFLDGQEIDKGDMCTDTGHLKVLTSKDVDIAVLETHHAGIIVRGLCFNWCDIAVCLNVTADHLGIDNVDTVAQMAAVKQTLPERARYAAVLNADDPYCLAMLKAVKARKVCLVSMESTAKELKAKVDGRKACFCILEKVDGEEWLVIHDEGRCLPVMAAARIPATFDGTARFNISNAMHAIVASYLSGVGIKDIHIAMTGFRADLTFTPGRLNVVDDLPFRIIVDYAHNPDGYRKLCEFVDRQKAPGRKLVAFAGCGDRTREIQNSMSSALAGHFDFYFCKEDPRRPTDSGPRCRPVAHIMQKGLMDAGVEENQTVLLKHGKEVIFEIFDTCEPGDLLVMLLMEVERQQISGYINEYARTLTSPITDRDRVT